MLEILIGIMGGLLMIGGIELVTKIMNRIEGFDPNFLRHEWDEDWDLPAEVYDLARDFEKE